MNTVHSAVLSDWVADWLDGIKAVAEGTNLNDVCLGAVAFDFQPSTLGIEQINLTDQASFIAAVATLDAAIRNIDNQLINAGFIAAEPMVEPMPQNLLTTSSDAQACTIQLATAEGGITTVMAIAERIENVCAGAVNSSSSDLDRKSADIEIRVLADEVEQIRLNTSLFAALPLLQDVDGAWMYFVNQSPAVCFKKNEFSLTDVSKKLGSLSALTMDSATECQKSIEDVLSTLSTMQNTAAGYGTRLYYELNAASLVSEDAAAEMNWEHAPDVTAVLECMDVPQVSCPGDAAPQPKLCTLVRDVAAHVLLETSEVLDKMYQLAQSSSVDDGSVSDVERANMQIEFVNLVLAIDRIVGLASANGEAFLGGDSLKWSECLQGNSFDVRPIALGINDLSVSTVSNAASASTALEKAIQVVQAASTTVSSF